MTIRPDNELLDGTYGTTNPIQPNNKITSERHRDIIESKANRLNFGEDPDETTAEGAFVSETREKLAQAIYTVNNQAPDETGNLVLEFPSDIYYIEGAPLHIETGELFSTTLYKLGDDEFTKDISFTTVINNSETVTDFSRIYFLSPDGYNYTIIGASLNDTSSAYLVGGAMIGDDELSIRVFVTNENGILTKDSGVVFSVNDLDPDDEGNVKVLIPQAGAGIETTFDPEGNPVFNMMLQILFEGPFASVDDLPDEGLSNTIYLVGEAPPYNMYSYIDNNWVSLGGFNIDLSNVVKSVNGIGPDSTGNVNLPSSPTGDAIVNTFRDVWSQPTDTQFLIPPINGLTFLFQRYSNGTYLPYIMNNSGAPLNIWFRTVQFYDGGTSMAGDALSSVLTVNDGTTSPALDNDTSGLGYGSYPNNTTLNILNEDTGEYYEWEMMASAKGSRTTGGVIKSVIRYYP